MSENAIRGLGVCRGMATANSMHVMCEALGMALPGSAPLRANSPKMFDLARRSGARVVEMVLEVLRPRDFITHAFRNAVAAVLAVSGSINGIKHLLAAAIESGLELDVYSGSTTSAPTSPSSAPCAPTARIRSTCSRTPAAPPRFSSSSSRFGTA